MTFVFSSVQFSSVQDGIYVLGKDASSSYASLRQAIDEMCVDFMY